MYYNQFQYDKAVIYIQKSLHLRKELNYESDVIVCYANLAVMNGYLGDTLAAITYADSAIYLSEAVGDIVAGIPGHSFKAKVLFE